ncbi:MAG: MFS transporter [Bacteroidetes bacterium]|nr:MFS transporter [Bacteroidota bacterium]
MGKVVLLVQYEVKENKRSEYLAAVEKLKSHYATNQFVSFSVYEQKGKPNAFAEMFLAHSDVVYKKFEESEDNVADELAAKLQEYIEGKTKYSTYFETK